MKFITTIHLFFIIGLILTLASCSDEEVLIQEREEDEINIVDEDAEFESAASKLKGTCPRGLSCGSPSCGLWTDLNSDSQCDRGV